MVAGCIHSRPIGNKRTAVSHEAGVKKIARTHSCKENNSGEALIFCVQPVAI
jgi:hypothetical protein